MLHQHLVMMLEPWFAVFLYLSLEGLTMNENVAAAAGGRAACQLQQPTTTTKMARLQNSACGF
jgi:hypothetical protein